MRLRNCALVFGAVAVSLCFLTPAIADPTYIQVDGAQSPPVLETYLYAINAKGDAAGYFVIFGEQKGFIYKHAGTVAPVKSGGKSTQLFGINVSGATAGYEVDEGKGFLGNAKGKIVAAFRAPGGPMDTQPQAINDSGEITGPYSDTQGHFHGFLRDAGGNITTFDAPGAGSNAGQGTFPLAINAAGSTAGFLVDSSNVRHCFLRDPAGAMTTFDINVEHTSTTCQSINANGVVAGRYLNGASSHGFVRAADGTMTTFDAPGAGTVSGQGTFTKSINKNGTIAGYVIDSTGATHGFLRAAGGKFTVFDMPDGGGVTVTATFAYSVNDKGQVAGYFTDASGVKHGFLRLP